MTFDLRVFQSSLFSLPLNVFLHVDAFSELGEVGNLSKTLGNLSKKMDQAYFAFYNFL